MRCRACEAQARRIAELEAELAAWRAKARAEAGEADDLERLAHARAMLGLASAESWLLLLLADRPGRVVDRGWLVERLRERPGATAAANPSVGSLMVYASNARARLRALGLPVRIENEHALGYRMPRDSAQALKVWLGEAVPGGRAAA